MKKVFAIAAVAALATAPAFAADLIIADDAISPELLSTDWSGFYIGPFGGYAWGNAVAESVAATTYIGASGALVGVTVGANTQFDSFVLGVEGDVAWSSIEGSTICNGFPAFTCGGSIDWLGTLRARAGLAVDQVLLYATAGAALGGVESTVTPVGAFTGEFSDTYVGWTAGVGAEAKLTDSVSAKLEYAYVDLGTKTAPVGTLSSFNPTDISPTLHTVKLGLNFAF